jgi:hypothetical protein
MGDASAPWDFNSFTCGTCHEVRPSQLVFGLSDGTRVCEQCIASLRSSPPTSRTEILAICERIEVKQPVSGDSEVFSRATKVGLAPFLALYLAFEISMFPVLELCEARASVLGLLVLFVVPAALMIVPCLASAVFVGAGALGRSRTPPIMLRHDPSTQKLFLHEGKHPPSIGAARQFRWYVTDSDWSSTLWLADGAPHVYIRLGEMYDAHERPTVCGGTPERIGEWMAWLETLGVPRIHGPERASVSLKRLVVWCFSAKCVAVVLAFTIKALASPHELDPQVVPVIQFFIPLGFAAAAFVASIEVSRRRA